MAKKKKDESNEPVQPAGPSGRALGALVALGAMSALWALFLWAELVVARSGGSAFCAVGDKLDCVALWDGDFASTVHQMTRLPVAGWGLLWAGLATAFPLIALISKSDGGPSTVQVTGTRILGAAGAVTTVGLIIIAGVSGTWCIGCMGTYVLVFLYALISLYGWRDLGFPETSRAVTHAFLGLVVGFAILIYPGIKTPANPVKAGQEAIANALKNNPDAPKHTAPPVKAEPPPFAKGPGTGDPRTDEQLEQFVLSLPLQARQVMSDSLHMFHDSDTIPMEPARDLHGVKNAPVKIVEWTDPLCGHCAQLHDTLKQLQAAVPPTAFSVEARYYPLDQSCNPSVPRKGDGLRCKIVGAQICLEGKENSGSFTQFIFDNQQSMNNEMLEGILKRYGDVEQIKKCVEAPETAQKLKDDLNYAAKLNPDGTPIVLINGKKGVSFPPFLYAIILTQGTGEHPAFRHLPPPNKDAHIH